MTIDEAIKELKIEFLGEYSRQREAKNIVIEALEQQKPMENFESVKDHILKLASDYKCWDNRITHDEALELCCILEQEPCEDAVSRQAVLDMATVIETDDYSGNEIMKVVDTDDIKALPSVAPARKKGRWIPHRAKYDKTASVYECSICHKNNGFENSKYCPHCGTEMESEE